MGQKSTPNPFYRRFGVPIFTCPTFCTTTNERVYITARTCELGFGGTKGLQVAGAGGLPAIEQIRSDPVTSARLRDVSALDAFLHDLPLLFRGSIYAWFPAHGASCLEALILPN